MALSVGRGTFGYITQEGKRNVLQSKASQENKAKHWGWVEEGYVRTRTPGRARVLDRSTHPSPGELCHGDSQQ